MKTKYLIILLTFLGFITSCDNPDEFKDVLYFSGAEESPVIKFIVEEPDDMGISVRASTKVSTDVKIDLKINNDLVGEYNDQKGTNYKLLPEGSYELSATNTTIESGQYSSKPVLLRIKSIDQFKDEDTYCVPITITNVEGAYPVLESSRTMYVVVNRAIITKAAVLNGRYFSVDFKSDPGRDLSNVPQLTMETRVYVNKFQPNNPKISTLMGLEENFLLRFGDVKIEPNILQLAGGGYPVSSTENFSAEKWYHIAATYDGKRICLYINGKLNAYTEAPRGGINLLGIDDTRPFFIGITMKSDRRPLNGHISETRIWTRALSEAEIANSMCAVSPDSPDLLAYWKFNSYKNEDNKNVVVDLTGHGYDAIGDGTVSFVEGVRCP